ncbi:MAG: inositol monophosphatase [Thermotogae bacterium]|nr:inositol monophosphatase [Thermotogota bacterium]
MDMRSLAEEVCAVSEGAGDILLRYFGRRLHIERKGLRDIVTDADIASEEYIRQELSRRFPDIPFYGEETGGASEGLRWVVDPLDGTKNFARGLEIFAVSIALVEDATPLMGVVRIPTRGITVWAYRGGGAYAGERPLKLDEGRPLDESFLATGFPHGNPELVDPYVEGLRRVLKRAMAIRRLGSAAYDLAMVAYGLFDGFWEYGLAPWDTAAGAVIVEEAGAVLSEIDGKPWNIYSPTILVAKKVPYRQMLHLLSRP